MVFPDYAFGHDHRDFFTAAMAEQGGEVIAQIAIPPTETSFTRYLPRIPRDTEVEPVAVSWKKERRAVAFPVT